MLVAPGYRRRYELWLAKVQETAKAYGLSEVDVLNCLHLLTYNKNGHNVRDLMSWVEVHQFIDTARHDFKIEELTKDLWLEFIDNGHCGLCGNSGKIFVETKTNAGISVCANGFCICPNGRLMKGDRK